MSDTLERARDAYGRQQWRSAFEAFVDVDRRTPLGPEDLELLGMAAALIGEDEAGVEARARAHQAYLDEGRVADAARCGFWLGMQLINGRGEVARGGGWLARATRLLEEAGLDCPERGYLMVPAALRAMEEGDPRAAWQMFEEAAAIAERFKDPELITMTRLGRAQSLVRMGELSRAAGWLDEVMVAVESGETSPLFTGIAYCAVVEACQEMFDVGRAQEWTASLSRWCDAHPDLVPFRGQCLVHRSEVMQLHGEWTAAFDEAGKACERLTVPPGQPAAGAAFYQLAELHRLRGDLARAEEAYLWANDAGASPHPGLALLRLAEGQVEAAHAALVRTLEETPEPIRRWRLLSALVDVALEGEEAPAARDASEELGRIAEAHGAPALRAVAGRADGAVRLAEGDARAALRPLRDALTTWQGLAAPYEAARVRLLLGLAYREVGDEDSSMLELDAARRAFEELGAKPDVERAETLLRPPAVAATGGLTGRELEVLRLVAEGKTNRTIARELVISEKTVARHVSNIFAKLGLSSRAAATAHAYQHGLV